MKQPFIKYSWILGIVIAVYLLSLLFLINRATANTGGKLTYIYDDAYIHMGMAKNFVQQGVWGATPHEFTSTTSSPVWTLLISGIFAVAGVQESAPLWLNILFGILLLATVYGLLVRHGVSPVLILIALLGIWGLMPLPFLTVAGMEHILHTLLTILFVYCAARVMETPSLNLSPAGRGETYAMLGIAPILVMVRYEGLFLVAAAGLWLLLRRKFGLAAALGILTAIPVVIYAWINVRNGWFILPGSVLIKSSTNPIEVHGPMDLIRLVKWYVEHGYITTARDSLFTMLVVFGAGFFALVYRREKTVWRVPAMMLMLFVMICVLHFTFAAPFIRYYPYLLATGIFAVIFTVNALWGNISMSRLRMVERAAVPGMLSVGLVFLFATAPFVDRGKDLFDRTSGAMTNIYDQQYQMGQFVREYYNDDRIAMNDIGTTSFMSDVHLLDLVGLGTLDVAEIVVAKEPFAQDAARIDDVARDYEARIAIIYDAWYAVPDSWIPVGYWTTPSSGFLGSDTVTFYAIDAEAEAELIANLRDYSPRLSERVVQSGKYMEGNN